MMTSWLMSAKIPYKRWWSVEFPVGKFFRGSLAFIVAVRNSISDMILIFDNSARSLGLEVGPCSFLQFILKVDQVIL